MRIPLLRVFTVGALAALLGGCLGSDEALVARSSFSESFAGTYRFDEGSRDVPGIGRPGTVRLSENGADLVAETYDEAGKNWKPTGVRLRVAQYRDHKDQAIVQIGDGRSYAYLYYRADGPTRAQLWTIDCGKLSDAVREALGLSQRGADCTVTRLDQVEGAITAYRQSNAPPDYSVTIDRGDGRSSKIEDRLSRLTKGATALGTDEILKRVRGINPTLSNYIDEEDDPESFGNRAAGPIGQTWAALARGDFGGAWRVIWHSWIIFALIAFVIGMMITRRCRPPR